MYAYLFITIFPTLCYRVLYDGVFYDNNELQIIFLYAILCFIMGLLYVHKPDTLVKMKG